MELPQVLLCKANPVQLGPGSGFPPSISEEMRNTSCFNDISAVWIVLACKFTRKMRCCVQSSYFVPIQRLFKKEIGMKIGLFFSATLIGACGISSAAPVSDSSFTAQSSVFPALTRLTQLIRSLTSPSGG